jgi:DNA-binding NarL/FixJ family response regulator
MATTADPVRILLVDDHTLFRDGLKEILTTVEDFDVVGEAGDAGEAVSGAAEIIPDVVLLDVQLPGGDVTSTVRRIRQVSPHSQVIILSMYDSAELLHGLLALGISGYLVKNATRHELVSAIRSSLERDGRVVLSVSRHAIAPNGTPPAAPLSPRELEVLALAGQAMSNAQIARQLFLTEATVKRHLRNIFGKLEAVSRIDAVNKAIEAGLLPAPQPRSLPAGAG